MDGGAWQSEVFDDRTRAHVQRASPGMEGGNPPPMYNPSPMPTSKDSRAFGKLIVSLRSALVLISLVAIIFLVDSKRVYNSYYDYINEPLLALLIMNIIVCVYAVVQVVLSLVIVASTGAFVSSPTKGGNIITFLCDLLLSYAFIAAAAVGANTGSVTYVKMVTASVVMSFVAFAVLAVLVVLYLIRLLRMFK